MRKGAKLVVKAASLRGHQSIDTYALGGFSQAMDRLQKECPGKYGFAAPNLGIDLFRVPLGGWAGPFGISWPCGCFALKTLD